jgi:hypothetical protein
MQTCRDSREASGHAEFKALGGLWGSQGSESMNGAENADLEVVSCEKAIVALENELPRLLSDPHDPERVMARLVWAKISDLHALRSRLLACAGAGAAAHSSEDMADMLATG